MPIKRPECHQRTIRRIIEDATRKPVRIRPAWAWDRARTDAPYYFGWLPTELSNKVIHPQNFITVEGGLHLPSSMNVAERGAMFRYVDDLLTMRLVNRAFAYRYKSTACVHALRRMMHARAHTRTQDMHWMFGMHCTALLMTRMAPTVEEQGVVALQLLKTVVVARMMQEMRGADVQPTVSEMAAQMPSTIPRFT